MTLLVLVTLMLPEMVTLALALALALMDVEGAADRLTDMVGDRDGVQEADRDWELEAGKLDAGGDGNGFASQMYGTWFPLATSFIPCHCTTITPPALQVCCHNDSCPRFQMPNDSHLKSPDSRLEHETPVRSCCTPTKTGCSLLLTS